MTFSHRPALGRLRRRRLRLCYNPINALRELAQLLAVPVAVLEHGYCTRTGSRQRRALSGKALPEDWLSRVNRPQSGRTVALQTKIKRGRHYGDGALDAAHGTSAGLEFTL